MHLISVVDDCLNTPTRLRFKFGGQKLHTGSCELTDPLVSNQWGTLVRGISTVCEGGCVSDEPRDY